MKYLLDTDICIFLLNGKDCVAQKIDEVGIEDCAISEVTKAELLVGEIVSKIKGRLRRSMPLELLFNRITIIPMSNSVKRYAENKAKLIVTGKRIEDFDLIIASTAQAHGLTLVTGTISHMSRIDGLEIDDWTER